MPAGVTPHSIIISEAGVSIVGGMVSLIVINWVTLIEFPQSSVTLYVLVIVSGQDKLFETSEIKETTGCVVTLSISSSTSSILYSGTSSMHWTLIESRFEAVGASVSFTLISKLTLTEQLFESVTSTKWLPISKLLKVFEVWDEPPSIV